MINLHLLIEQIILSFLLILILDKLGKKLKYFDIPTKNKIHKTKVTNISGLGFVFLIINSFFFYDYSEYLNFSLTTLIIFIIIGFLDDIAKLNVSSKIFLMLFPISIFLNEIGLVTTLGEYKNFNLELKSFSFLFTFCSILLLTNAYNYIDGMDGLLSTLSICSLTFFLIILPKSETNFIYPFIIFLIVFLIFNLQLLKSLPQTFIGDSGSICIGFLFCIITIYYTQNLNFIHESIAIWPIAFVVYEFLTINIIRIKNNKNPFKRDLNFIFNLFLNKFSKKKTLFLCNLINLLFCILGYLLHITKKYELSILLFVILFFVYLYLRIKENRKDLI